MRTFLPFLLSATLVTLTALLAGCATAPKLAPLKTVPFVDLERYTGRWYVIANIPYFLERGKVASYDTYARRPDGTFTNNFTFRRETFDAPEKTWHGSAKITNKTTNAEWAVQFVWPFSADYLVIDLDPDYRWAVIGHPSRDLLWVLARDRQLPGALYNAIVARTATQGYDPARIAKVPQPAN
ncbi:MAG: lipocalin family protein [Undibacterium sp.]|nr:lipocalin family protein [Opitutaceae bacterium]